MLNLESTTTTATFVLIEEPRPETDFETKAAKTLSDGTPLVSYKTLVIAPGMKPAQIKVRVPGNPAELCTGQAVRFGGLAGRLYSLAEDKGDTAQRISFSAQEIAAI